MAAVLVHLDDAVRIAAENPAFRCGYDGRERQVSCRDCGGRGKRSKRAPEYDEGVLDCPRFESFSGKSADSRLRLSEMCRPCATKARLVQAAADLRAMVGDARNELDAEETAALRRSEAVAEAEADVVRAQERLRALRGET